MNPVDFTIFSFFINDEFIDMVEFRNEPGNTLLDNWVYFFLVSSF